MAKSELSVKREEIIQRMRGTINRRNNGRSIVYDIPAGLGKTKAMLRVIGERLRAGLGDVIVAGWQSTNQMLDAVGVGIPGVELRDCIRDVPKDWHREDGITDFTGIPGLIYRGKEQVCEVTDKSRSCFGCPFSATCRYTWQKAVMSKKILRVVFGTHALLRGDAARTLYLYLGPVDHVIIDENNHAFMVEITLTHEQLMRVMMMFAWQLGEKGYPDLPPAIAQLSNKPTAQCYTARQQASALLDAFNTLRNEGQAFGNWMALRHLLNEVIDEPFEIDDSTDQGANQLFQYRQALNAMRKFHGDTEAHIEPGGQRWREGRRAARDLLALVERLLDPHDLRKLVRVDPGKRAGQEPTLHATWCDKENQFYGANGDPADVHYLDATPHELMLKHMLGFFEKDKFEYHQVTVPDQNVDLTIYASQAAYNSTLKLMNKHIMTVVSEMLAEHGGELLLVMPTIELSNKFGGMFRSRPEVHVSHIQVLPGVNIYEHCHSVVICGNYIPGADGLADSITMLYGRPMTVRRQQEAQPTLAKLPPGPAGADNKKVIEFGTYQGVPVAPVADAHIGDAIWQAIARTRPLDKEQPVKAVYIGNYDLPGYLLRMGRPLSLPIKHLDLKRKLGLPRRQARTSIERLQLLCDVFGGVILEHDWLRLRRDTKGKPMFADWNAANYFINWIDDRKPRGRDATDISIALGLKGYNWVVGLGKGEPFAGMFISQEFADATMGDYKAEKEEFQRKQLEARIVNRSALSEQLVKLIRSFPQTSGKLFQQVSRRKEFKLIERSELNAQMLAELDLLTKNGTIINNNGKYSK